MIHDTQVNHEMQVLSSLQQRLAQAYQDRRTPEEVAAVVDQAFHRFDQAPIRDFIPLLVEHLARDLLGRNPSQPALDMGSADAHRKA